MILFILFINWELHTEVTALGPVNHLHQSTFMLFWQCKAIRMCTELLQQLDSLNASHSKQWSEQTWLTDFSQAVIFRKLIQG